MDVPALGAAIGWVGTAVGGATLFVKNAKKVEQMIYGAVREVKDLQVLPRVDLNNWIKVIRTLENTVKASSATPAAPVKKTFSERPPRAIGKKAAGTKPPTKRQPRKAGK